METVVWSESEVADEESNTDSPLTDHLNKEQEPTETESEELGKLFPFDDSLFHPSKTARPY